MNLAMRMRSEAPGRRKTNLSSEPFGRLSLTGTTPSKYPLRSPVIFGSVLLMRVAGMTETPSQIWINGDGNVVGSGNTVVILKQYFTGAYEVLRTAYIDPAPVFDRVHLEHFEGRDWLLAEVDRFLRDHDRGYFVLEASAGLGKTTFLAWLAQSRGYIHHFVELAPGLDGVSRGLRNLAAQLVLACNLTTGETTHVLPPAASRPEYLYGLLRQAAIQRTPGQRIVVVVDALDEGGAPSNQNVLGLPQILPPGVFFIVSQRPVPVALHVDTATTPRSVCRKLTAEGHDNRADMLHFLAKAVRWPGVVMALAQGGYSANQLVATLMEKCRGIWIYLHFVIHEIDDGSRSPLRFSGSSKWNGSILRPLLETLAGC